MTRSIREHHREKAVLVVLEVLEEVFYIRHARLSLYHIKKPAEKTKNHRPANKSLLCGSCRHISPIRAR
jgi:hypothetical protein